MWTEIAGGQLALLYDVQRAWVKETLERSLRWKLGRIVKKSLNIMPGRRVPEETFVCGHCGQRVPAVAPGARSRSHCPHCLWSLHTPAGAGETPAACNGAMEPVGVAVQSGGEWSVVHRCRRCNITQVHAVTVDDNGAALLTVALRPAKAGIRA